MLQPKPQNLINILLDFRHKLLFERLQFRESCFLRALTHKSSTDLLIGVFRLELLQQKMLLNIEHISQHPLRILPYMCKPTFTPHITPHNCPPNWESRTNAYKKIWKQISRVSEQYRTFCFLLLFVLIFPGVAITSLTTVGNVNWLIIRARIAILFKMLLVILYRKRGLGSSMSASEREKGITKIKAQLEQQIQTLEKQINLKNLHWLPATGFINWLWEGTKTSLFSSHASVNGWWDR